MFVEATVRNATRWSRIATLTSVLMSLCFGSIDVASGQQVTNSVPVVGLGQSFHEFYGFRWGFRGNGFNVQGPNPAAAFPAFGGFDPNAAATLGFGGRNFSFNFMASQGSDRSISSATPMITLPNGGMGSIYDTSLRPFVVGVVPVVGASVHSPLRERIDRLKAGEAAGTYVRARSTTNADSLLINGPAAEGGAASVRGDTASDTNSTATRGDLSVADIRRQQAAEQQLDREKMETLLEQARHNESLGKPGVARVYYQQAIKFARGEEAAQIRRKVDELGKR